MSKQKYTKTPTSADGTPIKKGREQYSSEKLHARRNKRRNEAEKRQAIYDGLSIQARIAVARGRRGDSKREIARLEKRLAAQKAPAPKQAPLTPEQKAVKTVKRGQAAAKQATKHHTSVA